MRTSSAAFFLCCPLAAAEPLVCMNLDPAQVPELVASATAAGLELISGDLRTLSQVSQVIVVQVDDRRHRINDASAATLEAHVRAGGSLLMTLSDQPGNDAFRCAPFLPTTAWQTLLPLAHRGGVSDPVRFGGYDAEFFSQAPHGSLTWHWRLKPMHAAERGEVRYEAMARTQSYVNLPRAAGEPFLSRNLLNRDWRVRLTADDVRHDGLLITGRYGAGRVAVFAADARQGDRALWSPTLRWLTEPRPSAVAMPADCKPVFRVDAAGRRLVVTARNPGTQALNLPVVVRMTGWDGAPIGDRLGELALPAGGSGELAIALPSPDALAAQVLADCDVLRLHVAVLEPDGSKVLGAQQMTADFRPIIRGELSATELRARTRTFAAPGPETLKLPSRGGTPVSTYAVKPGEVLGVDLLLRNGLDNLAWLARLAQVRDATSGAEQDDVVALNDGFSGRMGPRDSYRAWGAWRGIEKVENILEFSFPAAVTLSAVALNGDVVEAGKSSSNPGAVVIEIDGAVVVSNEALDQRFQDGNGLVTLPFATPVVGKVVRIRMPWAKGARGIPVLGEIELWGWQGPPPVARTAVVDLKLIVPGSEPVTLKRETVALAGGGSATFHLDLAPSAHGVIGACRIDALVDGHVIAELPILAIDPPHPLRSMSELIPKDNAYSFGAIVTRGFRSFCQFASGSRDTKSSWGSPEDLVFAYARGLKQTSHRARTHVGHLYLSEHDFRHYANPWTRFPNGESFFATTAPEAARRVRDSAQWKQAEVVNYAFSDRWDTGPSVDNMWTWQEMVEFDRWLGAQGQPRLTSRTREALAKEILADHRSRFRAWQLQRYLDDVTALGAEPGKDGKRYVISAQGTPLVPLSALPRLAGVIQGMSDDNTWGAIDEDLPRTAGRQMAVLAFNPSWQMRSNFVWGWDNAILSNSHWYAPAGTTETSRRHHVTRAWRSTIDLDGTYKPMFRFGYGMNGYAPYFTSREDWQQNWNAAERGSLIAADGPIGAGVIVSTGVFDDPERIVFSGGGMGGSHEADRSADGVARLIGLLHHAGVSVPFAANVTAAGQWHGRAPLILADLAGFMPGERAQVVKWAEGKVPLVGFTGGKPLSDDLAALFAGAIPVADLQIAGKPVLVLGNRVLIDAAIDTLDLPAARDLAAVMRQVGSLDIIYPEGCAGYGFTMAGKRLITIEDWQEKGRETMLKIRANGRTASAIGLSEHRIYAVQRDGDWWTITVPLRSGDGNLILVEEQP